MSLAAAVPALPDWSPCYRLVASRFPPVGLFDEVATSAELAVVFAIQGMTNPRLRQDIGEIDLVPEADRVFGPGSSPVMAAFCHLNADGSRFSDGTWGVYYAASTLATAVAEVSYHRARFLSATAQAPMDLDLRSYVTRVVQPLHDVRGAAWDALHDPQDYSASVRFARMLRLGGAWGLIYRSVRDPQGECVAVLRAPALAVPVQQGPHVTLHWNGHGFSDWYLKSGLHPFPP